MSADGEPSIDGWTLREARHGDQLVRWIERDAPGRPGIVERLYDESTQLERFGAPIPGLAVTTRPAPKPVAVLSDEARRSIEHAATWLAGQGDNREVGGVLYGGVRADGVVEITGAREASKRRGSWFVTIDMEATSARLGERAIGDFHTHSERPEPSDQDLRAWRAHACRLRPDLPAPFVSVIAVVGRYGQPRLHGYATTWDGETKPILL